MFVLVIIISGFLVSSMSSLWKMFWVSPPSPPPDRALTCIIRVVARP